MLCYWAKKQRLYRAARERHFTPSPAQNATPIRWLPPSWPLPPPSPRPPRRRRHCSVCCHHPSSCVVRWTPPLSLPAVVVRPIKNCVRFLPRCWLFMNGQCRSPNANATMNCGWEIQPRKQKHSVHNLPYNDFAREKLHYVDYKDWLSWDTNNWIMRVCKIPTPFHR